MNRVAALVGLCALLAGTFAYGASDYEFDRLKREVEDLRTRLNSPSPTKGSSGPVGRADAVIANKYGPNAKVSTKEGKLTIGGLLQVWNYNIQNDNKDFDASIPTSTANGGASRGTSNELFDNDSYRIRRAELKFDLDITEDITAVVIIDPTGGDEANTFPGIPTNQGVVGKTVGGTSTVTGFEAQDISDFLAGRYGGVARRNMNSGAVAANRMLQDAYINYHPAFIRNHDFTIGQFKPPIGEEGNRNSGQLDFVERAMINQFSNQRDLGLMVHGYWFGCNPSDSILHYWVGGFNTPGSFHNTFASFQNRSNDNDSFDLAWKIRLRPLWKHEKWGSVELGFSRQDGVHGEAGKGLAFDPATTTVSGLVDGLSLQETHAFRQWAWASYNLGDCTPVRGWWLRGEWAHIKDRALPGVGAFQSIQLQPQPFSRDGWYFSTGYELARSIWADDLEGGSGFWGLAKSLLRKTEWTFRYENFGNIITDDIPNPNETDVFKTKVWTAGVNIYWKGDNVRTQVNYLWVDEPNRDHLPVHITEVRNNVFIVSNQIKW